VGGGGVPVAGKPSFYTIFLAPFACNLFLFLFTPEKKKKKQQHLLQHGGVRRTAGSTSCVRTLHHQHNAFHARLRAAAPRACGMGLTGLHRATGNVPSTAL